MGDLERGGFMGKFLYYVCTMDREFILKNTASFTDHLLEDLKDPEFARRYLEVSVNDYKKDGDAESLVSSIRDIAQAQGKVGYLPNELMKLAHFQNVGSE